MNTYEANKAKARELFKQAIEVKKEHAASGLPVYKLGSKLYPIIEEMANLGYSTRPDWIAPKSEGGKVEEREDLQILHAFTEKLGLKAGRGYASIPTIYGKLTKLGLGRCCSKCGGSGEYTLAIGSTGDCFPCSGHGRIIKLDEKTLAKIGA